MLSLPETTRPPSPQHAEVARVRSHLRRAEQLAVAHQPLHASRQQRLVRALLLEELGRYRKRGRFPMVMREGSERAPCFVDGSGTRCALAHLLELGGEAELVQRIAQERNRARVRELADEPRLRAWLSAVGLTLNEAASIQPEYCFTHADSVSTQGQLVARPQEPAQAVLEGTISALVDGKTYVHISELHGDAHSSYLGATLAVHILAGEEALRPGATVLIPVRGGSAEQPATQQGIMLSSEIGAMLSVDAVGASDCAAVLEQIGKSRRRLSSPDGWASAPVERTTPNTLSVLLTLVSALAQRAASSHS